MPLSTATEPVNIRLMAADPVIVSADTNRLRQCLENLIANAIHVSPSGIPVTVTVGQRPRDMDRQWAYVEICDEGPGIAPEILPRIFDRFATGNPREGGLGLGLYLAKRIVALHGGELNVDSTPGRGSRFTVLLPIVSSDATSSAAEPASNDQQANSERTTAPRRSTA